jgi:hypothetical protein
MGASCVRTVTAAKALHGVKRIKLLRIFDRYTLFFVNDLMQAKNFFSSEQLSN